MFDVFSVVDYFFSLHILFACCWLPGSRTNGRPKPRTLHCPPTECTPVIVQLCLIAYFSNRIVGVEITTHYYLIRTIFLLMRGLQIDGIQLWESGTVWCRNVGGSANLARRMGTLLI